jgi:hypothetical protein
LDPLIVTGVPADAELTEMLVIVGVGTTVKTVPARLDVELLVTITFPVAAPLGTFATTVDELQLVVVAVTPLKVTVPEEPKLYPLIVTLAPTGPELGDSVVMLGITVNGLVLLVPFEVWTATCTDPGVPSVGTNATIEVELQLSTKAVALPTVTVPVPWLILKLVPVIVTELPVMPDVTDSEVIVGVGSTLGVTDSFAM